jgi:CelD/BcsL family acetyltransferase involved in cellulose biosynthesis
VLTATGSDWAREYDDEVLTFKLGGHDIWTLALRAHTLTTPITKLSHNLGANLPIWDAFPGEIHAAVIPAQPVETGLSRLAFPPGNIRYVASCAERYFVALDGSFHDYLQKFRAKARHNLKRTVRMFGELSNGDVRCLQMFSPANMEKFRECAIRISRNTWQERVGGPGFPRSEEFGTRMADLAAKGLARGTVLFHRDRPVSYALCLVQDDCLLYARTAYDEAYAAWSPGRVLLFLLLERLFDERKYRRLDFGEGTLPYKQFFSTGYVRCARVIYFRRSARNLAVVLSHWSLSTLSRCGGRVLELVGLEHQVRSLTMGKVRRPGQ